MSKGAEIKLLFCTGCLLVILLVLTTLYCLTLQRALDRVSPRNRLMRSGMVWLLFIPLFNLFWQYVVAVRVADSLRNEFRDRLRDDGSDYGRSLGATQTILLIFSIGAPYLARADEEIALMIFGVVQLVGFALFVSFWVKIASYSRKLAVRTTIDRAELDRRLATFDQFNYEDQDVPKAAAPTPPPDYRKEGDPGHYQ